MSHPRKKMFTSFGGVRDALIESSNYYLPPRLFTFIDVGIVELKYYNISHENYDWTSEGQFGKVWWKEFLLLFELAIIHYHLITQIKSLRIMTGRCLMNVIS